MTLLARLPCGRGPAQNKMFGRSNDSLSGTKKHSQPSWILENVVRTVSRLGEWRRCHFWIRVDRLGLPTAVAKAKRGAFQDNLLSLNGTDSPLVSGTQWNSLPPAIGPSLDPHF